MTECPSCRTPYEGQPRFCGNCGSQLGNGAKAYSGSQKKSSWPLGILLVVLLLVLGHALNESREDPRSGVSTGGSGAHPAPSASTVPTEPQLELVKYAWHIEYGYAVLEGQVTNISSQSLRNVAAVASFYDSDGDFITSSDALIGYNPILPGQTSPFKVMASENPAMQRAGVEFKKFMGGAIPFRKAESRRRTKK